MNTYDAIGIVETQYLTHAMVYLDHMVKVADVSLLSHENYLGGRLVSLVVAGTISNVSIAIEAVRELALQEANGYLKMALVITLPHEEVMKYIVSKAS